VAVHDKHEAFMRP